MRPRTLCSSFRRLARWTWNELGWGANESFPFSEQYFTEHNLAQLRELHRREIRVVKFTQMQEAFLTGADWEWWIGSPRERRWIGLRVQAKKLETRLMAYPSLPLVTKSTGQLQVETLLRSAQSLGRVPLYCLYNYWEAAGPFAGPNRKSVRARIPCRTCNYDRELYGCSIVPAIAVRQLIQARKSRLSELFPSSVPWSCLVCHGTVPGGSSIVHHVVDGLSPLVDDSKVIDRAIHPALPDYVVRAMSEDSVTEGPADLAGALVIGDADLSEWFVTQPRER